MPMSVDHAEDTLYNALKLDPANALTYRRLAGLYARNGTYKSAVVSLRAALELRPVDAEAYHELGVLLYRAAERVVWQVHKESPRIKPKPRRVPGDELTCWRSRLEPCFPVHGYGPRLDVAEEEMTERIGKDGSDTRAYLNLGTILRNQSMAAAIAAIRLRPTFGTAYLTVARNLQKGGSLGVYRRAIALLPKEPHVYLWYGEALDSVRYYKQANRAYKQAVALDPAMLEGYAHLAELRLTLNRSSEAYVIAHRALRLVPTAAEAVLSAAGGGDGDDSAGADDGVAAATLAAFAAAAEAGGSPPSPAAAGDADDEDDEDDDISLRRPPVGAGDVAGFVVQMAEASLQDEAHAEAARLSRAALRLAPATARAYATLGRALLNDDEERALESLNLAVELNSHDAASRWKYAERLRHLPGRLTEATDHMRAVLRTVDSHPQAARTLDEDVKRLRDLNDPPRTWQRELANLSALVIFVVAIVLFTMKDEIN